jgi:uncharacterized membrane protein YphA (DoxX/SURF4 family)
MTRHSARFAAFVVLIATTFAAGLALHGRFPWPPSAEARLHEQGTTLLALAGVFTVLAVSKDAR